MRRRKSSWYLLLVLLAGIAVIGSYSLSWGLTNPGIGVINQVTPDGTDNAQGQWINNMGIVYMYDCSSGDGEIHKIGADGLGDTNISDPSDIYHCDSKPVVSPEGDWIVFQRAVSSAGPGDWAGIWKMDINGQNQSALVPYDAVSERGFTWPSISPDGNQVAYRCGGPGHGNNADLCVVPFAGGTPTQLTVGGWLPHHGIGWLSTGGVRRSTRALPQILTSLEHEPNGSPSTHGPPYEYTRDVAKVSLTGVTTWLADITNTYCTLFPKVDPLGKIVYQDDTNNYGDVMIMNADGTGKVRLTSSAGTGDSCYNHPEPHTSGQYIAMWSDVNDALTTSMYPIFRVWIMTRDGRFMAPITTEADCRGNRSSMWPRARWNLEFSPDGSSLLFVGTQSADDGATCNQTYSQIHIIALDTGDDDFDGLLNWQELVYGTNPLNPDTDGGGEIDGSEALYGKDPTNPADDLNTPSRRTR